MNCDKLKRIESDSADTVLSCFQDVYEADSVDAAIAELKKELEHSNIELESYFIFEEEIKAELRATRRALWLARANSAEGQFSYWYARFAVESGFTKNLLTKSS